MDLAREALARIRSHAALCYPREAIGLLGGQGDAVRMALPLTNHAASGTLVHRGDLAEAERALQALGCQRIGAFHSHPDTAAKPSKQDLRTMRPGQIELIVPVTSQGAGQPRAWRLSETGAAVELPWD